MQLIILGMHRSGTSVLARLLNMMGAYFGPEGISTGASQENLKGFWERRDVRQLNDFVLHSVSCDWDKIANFDANALPEAVITEFREKTSKILLEMDSHRPWLLKEPRLCLIFNLWKELLEVPVCIHIYRNPVEVANSLYTRNGIPTYAGIALWEKYNLSALEASHGLPRFVVSHNKLMSDPVSEVKYIYEQLLSCGVDGLRLPSEKEITSFVRKDLYREKVNDKEISQFLNVSQAKIFNEFKSGSILNKINKFKLTKSSISALEQYEDKEKQLIKLLNQKEQNAKDALELSSKIETDLKQRLELEKESLTQQIKQKEQEVKIAQESANKVEAELSRQLEHTKKELIQSENDIATLNNIVSRLIKSAHVLGNSTSWKLGNAIISLRYKLLFKSAPPLPTNYIDKVISEYNNWSRPSQKKENFSQKDTSISEDEAGRKLGHKKSDKGQVKPTNKVQNKNKIPYTPLPDTQLRNRIQEYKASNIKKRAVVYTAVIGNYDVLKVPETLNPEYDYVCFTDTPIQDHPVWTFRPATYFNADTTRIARYYKLHPHFYLSEYDVAVWVDANILIRKDINYLVKVFLQGGEPLGAFNHYQRNCTYSEATACIGLNKDECDVIEKQIKRYNLDGLSDDKGLLETNILISKPNNLKTRAIFNLWWKELDNGSKRDQISVMYVLWKTGANYTPLVDSISKMARFDRENFELFEHQNKTSYSHPSTYQIPPFLQTQYKEASKTWCELLNPLEVTDSILWKFRKKTVDIIIPIYNALDDVKQCLDSVEPTLLDTHRLIIVDDGSEDDTKIFLEEFVAKRNSYVTLIRHDIAGGYTKAANAGMRATESDFVILLNSDTIVPALWILKLVQCAEDAKEIGIIGPMSNAASWQSIPDIKEKEGSYSLNPLPSGITVQDMDLMCQKYSLPEFPRVQLVNGFCFCIKRAVIDQIGLFDEDSYPKGYNEENDYCFRATDAGFDLSIATHTYVYHAKSKSYTPKKRLLLCEESRKVFEKTYGVYRINRATESVRNHPLINKTRTAIKKALTHV